MQRPDTHYARTRDGLSIAYQAWGDGPFDLVFSFGLGSNIEMYWDHPHSRRFFERLASFSRLLIYDRRGTGASDHADPEVFATWEPHIDDLRAVLAAARSEQAALFGMADVGTVFMLFAAAHPALVTALVTFASVAHNVQADGYPFGFDAAAREAVTALISDGWGTATVTSVVAPSLRDDPAALAWYGRLMRTSCTPNAAAVAMGALTQLNAIPVLSSIRVPMLVLEPTENPITSPGACRYVADHVEGARYVAIPGTDLLPWEDVSERCLEEVEEFLTGARNAHRTDRMLATVLFTDIVESTERAHELGDRRWKDLLDSHDRLAASMVNANGGRIVNTTGDGLVATFDVPGRAIRCAIELSEGLRQIGIHVRAGLHAGEVELRGEDIGGIAVHIGHRVSALAGPGEVYVSRTVNDLVAGSGLQFEERGEYELKGVPGKWAIYAVKN